MPWLSICSLHHPALFLAQASRLYLQSLRCSKANWNLICFLSQTMNLLSDMCVSTQCHTHKAQSDRSRTKKKLSVIYFRARLLLQPTILKTAHTCYFTGTWLNTVRVHFKTMTCGCLLWQNKTLRVAWSGWRQLGTSANCCSVHRQESIKPPMINNTCMTYAATIPRFFF